MRADRPIGIGLVRPDLLGTYGDAGNATVLAQRLRWRGLPAEVVPLERGASIPRSVRVLVLGGGEDRSQTSLLDDTTLLSNLIDAVEGGAAVLGVCAGLQILGRSFIGPDGAVHTGLGLLDCRSHRSGGRAVGEVLARRHARPAERGPGDDPGNDDALAITGFENHAGRTELGPGSSPLARVVVGTGNGDGTDGAVSGRVIGTYLHGPVLVRNPRLADEILETALGELPELRVPAVDLLRRERKAAAAATRRSRLRRLRTARAARSARLAGTGPDRRPSPERRNLERRAGHRALDDPPV